MRKISIRTIALMMSLIVFLASACSNNSVENNRQGEVKTKEIVGTEENQSAETSAETKVVRDHRNVDVTIPKNPKRIVICSGPLPAMYCLFRGGPKDLIGISDSAMSTAKNSYLSKAFPEILNLATGFQKAGKVNIEEVMKLNPDLILYGTVAAEEAEMYENSGIPAIAFFTGIGGTNRIETLTKWMELLGEIFGEEDNSKGVVEFGRNVIKNIREKVKDIPEENKPTALAFTGAAGGKLKIAGGDVSSSFWITTTGGKNVASDIKGSGSELNMEQLLKWNPDIILINNFCPHIPEDFIENKIEGYDFSEIKAVKNKQVYKYPMGMYGWAPVGSEYPLTLMWVAKIMQPEVFNNIDLDKEVKEYYKKFYNFEITDEDLKQIYNPPRRPANI